MPGKMARSDPRPSVRVTRGAGSSQHLASVLQEGRENANIDAGLGFIWRISVIMVGYGRLRSRTTPPLGRFSATYLDHSKHSCCAPQKRVRRTKTIFPTTVCCGGH